MIKKESKLKKGDKKLRADLSEKTFQLKIESSLEKVRAAAMKMKNPEHLLNICQALFKELTKLGFTDLRNAMINIHNDVEKTFVNYDYSDQIGRSTNRFTNNILPFVGKIIRTSQSAENAFSESNITGKALAEFKKLRKQSGQKDDPRLSRTEGLYFYFYSIGIGSIGISTFAKIDKEKKVLLKRFRNVFNLSYQRYVDISKAEAQARESQVQLALERVRARTNAMQKSDELPETTFVLFQQLRELGETAAQISIGVIKEDEGVVELSATVHGNPMSQVYKVPIDEPYVMKKAVQAWKARQKSVKVEIKGQELKRYNQWRNSVLKKKIKFHEDQWIVNIVFFSRGLMSFSSDKQIPYETLLLLERFAAVFDQTYTRFLDLKKAEEQAREAEIELALERVRARTMAMYHSEELKEVISLTFEQIKSLNIIIDSCIITLFIEGSDDLNNWVASSEQKYPHNVRVPYFKHPLFDKIVLARNNPGSYFTIKLSQKENQLFYKHILENSDFGKIINEDRRKMVMNAESNIMSFANFQHIGLRIGNFSGHTYSEEENNTVLRFANVFEQTYTRFLDLQKAEAQAREAQIEAALEKVRSRSLAMHRSDELQEVVHTVFEKLKELNVDFYTVIIVIFQENSKDIFWWLEAKENQQYPKVRIPYSDIPYLKDLFEARLRGQVLLSKCYFLKEKNKLYHHLFTNTDFKNVPEKQKKFLLDREFAAMSTALAKNTGIHLTNYFKQSFSEVENEILQRFAKVFDQAYTRFLDLQKAEEQAKEAKIEAALEKIRSRSLAMHHADELIDVITVLREKLKELDIAMESRTVLILTLKQGSRDFTQWVARPEDKLGKSRSSCFETPYFDHPILIDFWNTKNNGLNFLAKVYTPEEKNSFFKNLFKNTNNTSEQDKNQVSKPGYYAVSAAIENNSAIIISSLSGKLLSEKENEILKRFSRVFEQAYIRFLDLQKADAQAREAQIEASLERVRSRTMGMQKSEELKEVIQVVYEQFVHLNVLVEHAGFIIDYKERDDMNIWLADKREVPFQITIPYFNCAHWNSFKEAKEKEKDFFANHLSFEEKNKFYHDLFKLVPVPDEVKEYYFNCPGLAISTVLLENVGLYIENFSGIPYTNEENNTLMRFGKVFQQTYTRFLDLQTAEALARETQIQLALERVRARTMAMQHSNELSETSFVLFQQLKSLGQIGDQISIGIFNEEERVMELYATVQGNQWERSAKPSIDKQPVMKNLYKGWKEQKKSLVLDLTGQALQDYNKFRIEASPGHYVLQSEVDRYDELIHQERWVIHIAFFSKGILSFSSPEPRPAETIELLERFAGVFEQTYTRFLDLQKAEAQAREAQIELGLERVRARAMAMQKSEELVDLIDTVQKELTKLEFTLNNCILWIMEEQPPAATWWVGPVQNTSLPESYRVPFPDLPYFNTVYEAWNQRIPKWVYVLEDENKYEADQYLFNHTDLIRFPVEVKNDFAATKRVYISFSFHNYGGLHISTLEPLAEEQLDIITRFSKVFDMTYTRFLDLQKAEAQAREAQIEAALEKVRSRSLAMHKSDELQDVIQVVFDRLYELGIAMDVANINIPTKDPRLVETWMATKGYEYSQSFIIPWSRDSRISVDLQEAYESGNDYFSKSYSLEEKNEYLNNLFQNSDYRFIPDDRKAYLLSLPHYSISGAKTANASILIVSYSGKTLSDIDAEVLKRFARVFEQCYTRFLDLQKAEAQAREAQIEAALERVRSKAMAMHKTEDFHPAVAVVFEELEKLDLQVLRCGISVLNKEKRTGDVWLTSTTDHGSAVQVTGDEEFDIHPLLSGAFDAWLRQEDFSYMLEGDDLTNYYKAVKEARFGLPESQFISSENEFKRQYAYVAVYHAGGLFAFRETEFPEEAKKVMKRFANVFDLTYKRFLDLQKAEAQAREARIEVALERVRSKAMAMHKSTDLSSAVAAVFEELEQLDLGVLRCGICILNKERKTGSVWVTTVTEQGPAVQVSGDESFDTHPLMKKGFDAWLKQEDFTYLLQGDDLAEFYTSMKVANFKLPKSQMLMPGTGVKQQFWHVTTFHAGTLYAVREMEFAEEAKKVMKRFANVFDLTYKRFVDLQKAEAQAREAKIEAAMEKVRARAMSMQKADELVEVAELLRKEMGLLVEELETSSIYIHHEDSGTTECWYAIQDIRGDDKKLVTDHMTISLNDTWVGREMLKFYQSDQTQTSILMQGENRKEWINNCSQHSKVLQGYYGDVIPERSYHLVKFSNGYMGAASPGDISAQSWDLLRRATNVFSLAYTRFSDLKLAEAQAREATIEAALERVRAKAMAMHNSDDVSLAASMVFTELRKLGINPIRCGVGLLNNESLKAPLYSSTSSADGDSLSLVGWVMLEGHPVLEKIYQKWLAGEDYFPELSGESLKSYYDQLLSGLSVPVPDFKEEQKQYGHFFSFSVGCLYAWSEAKYSEDEVRILKRFASIIDLTFRRYMDLQKSEANAREAVKQAALDRIRADIASMRAVTDLDRITPLIWNELTILGLPFIRCGVFLMDDSQKFIHTFLSTPDGKAIGAFHMPYDTPGNLQKVLFHWRANERYADHWDEEEFIQFANILVRQGAISSPDQYLKTLPAGGFHLHFLPFLQGMLYVGNTTQLNEEQINIVQSVADAFSTAYARYEDFNKLEAAKQQIENTLVDLKQTQQQLIQSEKMASLGELTAGIAHEIQNPLNFVNNFSEVSNELLDEMKNELATGNGQQAIEIADDVKQNLEKILHHGKRADAIVKGMLQHSRTSSGQKELTDINVLADEYLRLAYHGLRAKDKTFNAKFETDLDGSIAKVNVVPQEIGRVILNLINNAFYAVTQKRKQLNGTYEPTVLITTKKLDDKIEIKVKDNGSGIPQKMMDKIFQPFFTTKPTGQGTGLGLSLSYDIITKGHGGELKVETKEGEGSEFTIHLPNLG